MWYIVAFVVGLIIGLSPLDKLYDITKKQCNKLFKMATNKHCDEFMLPRPKGIVIPPVERKRLQEKFRMQNKYKRR